MSNRRKSHLERWQQLRERAGRCADGQPHDWQTKPGYGVVCARCSAKAGPR